MADQNAADIVTRAQALIDKVTQDMASADDFYRDNGLNPEKARGVLKQHLDGKAEAEAHQQFQADLDAVEQEVREEQARSSFQDGSAGAPRRPRSMI